MRALPLLLTSSILALGAAGCSRGTAWSPPGDGGRAENRIPDTFEYRGFQDGENFRIERSVAPGIEHRFESRGEGDPLTVNVVTIDMATPELAMEAEKGQDALFERETLPAMSNRLADPDARPVVLVNADFWGAGSVPINLFVDEGTIWRGPWIGREGQMRPVFAFDEEGNRTIGIPEFSASVIGPDGEELEIAGINFPQDAGPLTAYTWPMFGSLEPAGDGERELFLKLDEDEWLPNAPVDATVADMLPEVPRERLVRLRTTAEFPAWLAPGTGVTLSAELANLPGKVTGVVGGGPILLDGERTITQEWSDEQAISQSFIETQHPRTAIGLKDGGETIIVMTVDGRQPGRSTGIDLYDLAGEMRAQGAEVAMNLDGGGSTSLVVHGETVNFPSDAGGPRSVTNALVFRRTDPTGGLADLEVLPTNVSVAPGAQVALTLSGTDEAGEPLDLQGRRVNWSIEGPGDITDAGVFTASGTGTATITATMDGVTDRAQVSVLPPGKVTLQPEAIVLQPDESATITWRAETAAGQPMWALPPVTRIEAPPFVSAQAAAPETVRPGMMASMLPATIQAEADGAAMVRVYGGGLMAEAPVAVGGDAGTVAFTFDALPRDPQDFIEAIRHKPDVTGISLETEQVKEGTAAWRFDYGMGGNGVSKIALPVDAQLRKGTLSIAVWVYGDEQRQWMRGEIRDAEGKGYYANFTGAGDGIDWEGWKLVQVAVDDLIPMGAHTTGPVQPLTVKSLYLAQAQEAAKRDGSILLDGLMGVGLPEGM